MRFIIFSFLLLTLVLSGCATAQQKYVETRLAEEVSEMKYQQSIDFVCNDCNDFYSDIDSRIDCTVKCKECETIECAESYIKSVTPKSLQEILQEECDSNSGILDNLCEENYVDEEGVLHCCVK